jgi:hypothetical protein
MNRRRLLSAFLPLSGVAIAASELVPEGALLHQIKPSKKYLLNIPHRISHGQMEHLRRCLEGAGLDNVTLTCGEFELYELE